MATNPMDRARGAQTFISFVVAVAAVVVFILILAIHDVLDENRRLVLLLLLCRPGCGLLRVGVGGDWTLALVTSTA